jgi:sucrose phosphorylase
VVYQFSLPPLLLHALHTGNARYLTRWSASLQPAPRGCTYLNFTASHDGIGLRPVEGILPHDEVEALVTGMQSAGGYGSFRDLGGGRRAVYELNITYFDALRGTAEHREDGLQVPRFVCSQLVALSLQGIPALYVQSVVATENDHERVDQIGAFRAINRSKWALSHVDALLDDPTAPQHHVYQALRHALSVRRQLPAFHPDVRQRTLPLHDDIFAIERLPDEGEPVLVLTNVTAKPVAAPLPPAYRGMPLRNALTDVTVDAGQSHYELDRYQVAWIVRQQ